MKSYRCPQCGDRHPTPWWVHHPTAAEREHARMEQLVRDGIVTAYAHDEQRPALDGGTVTVRETCTRNADGGLHWNRTTIGATP
jgi:hypothetical protein